MNNQGDKLLSDNLKVMNVFGTKKNKAGNFELPLSAKEVNSYSQAIDGADSSYASKLRTRKPKSGNFEMQASTKSVKVADSRELNNPIFYPMQEGNLLEHQLISIQNEDEGEEEIVEYSYAPSSSNLAAKVPARAVVGGTICGPKSLLVLAGKFFEFLHSLPEGLVDLAQTIRLLGIKQKRRIYDITAVLQGIGLVEKYGKNLIRWRGGQSSVKLKPEQREYIDVLRTELNDLDRYEHQLDDHIRWLKQSIRNVCEDSANSTLLYNTHQDLLEAFPASLIIILKAPPTASMEVKIVGNIIEPGSMTYELSLTSRHGPADMLVLNKDAKMVITEESECDNVGDCSFEIVDEQECSNPQIGVTE